MLLFSHHNNVYRKGFCPPSPPPLLPPFLRQLIQMCYAFPMKYNMFHFLQTLTSLLLFQSRCCKQYLVDVLLYLSSCFCALFLVFNRPEMCYIRSLQMTSHLEWRNYIKIMILQWTGHFLRLILDGYEMCLHLLTNLMNNKMRS